MAINHDLNTYIGKGCNTLEDSKFEGLMPKIAEKIGAAGTGNGKDVKLFEVESLGMGAGAMETADFVGLMEKSEEGGEEGGGEEQGPIEEESTSYDYIYDEASYNASVAGGALKKYYEKYPEEDCWNTAENRGVTYNDRYYVGTIDGVEVETSKVNWESDAAQSVTIDGVKYYAPIFYGFTPQTIELFNDVALTESTGKSLEITAVSYSEDCPHTWAAAVGAGGAKYPWIAPYFTEDVNAKVRFEYEGKDPVYPWGDKVFGAEGWGAASVANEFGDDSFALVENGGENAFDIEKFKMILVK